MAKAESLDHGVACTGCKPVPRAAPPWHGFSTRVGDVRMGALSFPFLWSPLSPRLRALRVCVLRAMSFPHDGVPSAQRPAPKGHCPCAGWRVRSIGPLTVAVDPSIADQEDSNGDQVRARTHAAASGRVG